MNVFTKHLYSDSIKWRFYHEIIDSQIKATKYSNGYIEFYSPRLEKRFIEKFYNVDKKTGQITSPGYGVATYVIDDEDYVNNRDKIVERHYEGNNFTEYINPFELTKLVPKGKENRIPHITQSISKNWMRLMVSEFGSVYSKEDKDKLEELLKEYESEHEIID